MRIRISHETSYAYAPAARSIIQVLRLTPRSFEAQYVVRWRVSTDVDCVLRDLRAWIDDACTFAKVRDAIVTDGTRWTMHRKGDRQLRRREWSLDHTISVGCVDDMLNQLTEGL